MDLVTLLLLAAAVAAGACAQRAAGIGFTLGVAPACALALGPADALGTLVRVALIADVAVLVAERSAFELRAAREYLVPALFALPVAFVATHALPPRFLVTAATVATLAAVAFLARTARASAPRATERASGLAGNVAGFASGFMGLTTGMSGPPLAIHAVHARRPMATNRATFAFFFAIVDLVAVLAHPRAAGAPVLAVLVAMVLVGTAAGAPAASRIDERRLRTGLLVLVALGASAALARMVL
jgi:uncharacterized membrane protein YfcA